MVRAIRCRNTRYVIPLPHRHRARARHRMNDLEKIPFIPDPPPSLPPSSKLVATGVDSPHNRNINPPASCVLLDYSTLPLVLLSSLPVATQQLILNRLRKSDCPLFVLVTSAEGVWCLAQSVFLPPPSDDPRTSE